MAWFANEILAPATPSLRLPPEAFLCALKGLSKKHRVPIAYGYFSTWGGANELEYAWVFGDAETVLVSVMDDDTHLELNGEGAPKQVCAGLLENLCSRLGFELPTSFFAPHTRKFPWQKYRFASNTG